VKACVANNTKTAEFFLVAAKNEEKKLVLEESRKKRADTWADTIVSKTIDQDHLSRTGEIRTVDIDEGKIGVEKLNFEKLKYLASIDNPDKYGQRIKQVSEIKTHNILEIKGLSPKEAMNILRSDPFAPKEVIDITPSQDEEEEDTDHGLDYL